MTVPGLHYLFSINFTAVKVNKIDKMKISLYSRPHPAITAGDIHELFNSLAANGMDFEINPEFAEYIEEISDIRIPESRYYAIKKGISGDVMVSYGGDGTFLGAVNVLNGCEIPIVGINSGGLGFLANITKENLDAAMKDIAEGNYTIQPSALLEAGFDGGAESDPIPYAFNEVTVQRRGANMIAADIYVDGEMISTCRGDGVLLSTSSGSTAYSLSVGGPVVAPDCNCLIISPIAPHNLSMRPVVIPDTSEVVFTVHTRGDDFNISLDNHNYTVPDGTTIKLKRSKKSIFLIRLRNISFYDTLRNKMMWGVDGRDRQD